MDRTREVAPASLRAELDRSRDDLAAGRIRPVEPVLTAIRARAARRIARRKEAVGQAEARRPREPT